MGLEQSHVPVKTRNGIGGLLMVSEQRHVLIKTRNSIGGLLIVSNKVMFQSKPGIV